MLIGGLERTTRRCRSQFMLKAVCGYGAGLGIYSTVVVVRSGAGVGAAAA